MSTSWIPEGWAIEGADPSVGIFGEFIYHDDCPAGDVEDAEASTAPDGERWYDGERWNRNVHWRERWKCRACGVEVVVERMEWDPDVPEEED